MPSPRLRPQRNEVRQRPTRRPQHRNNEIERTLMASTPSQTVLLAQIGGQ
jgi:hypothetical protein